MRRQECLLVVLYFFLSVLTVNCSRREEPETQTNTTAASSSNVADISSVEQRSGMVPNFSWKDSSGKTVDFDSYRGKVTLINFWATWCGPCKRELPDLAALSAELAPRSVRIIGVSTDRGVNVLTDVRAFVQEHGLPYQNVISTDELEEAFGNVRALPTSFIVNAQGKIIQTIVGMRSKEFYSQALTSHLQ